MNTAVALGARLAFGTRGQRSRSATVVAACAIGTTFLLTVWGIAVDQLSGNAAFQPRQITYLISGTVLMVALPVLALLATVGRLSAAVRDRRLANLRLLGMSDGQTRLAAGTEVGIASGVGTVLGAVLHPLVAALVPIGALAPASAWIAVLLAVPVAVILIALLPQRRSARSALEDSRQAVPAPPGWWRLAPLVVGVALCWWAHHEIGRSTGALGALELAELLGGIALIGVGVLVVVPVFVRLVAAAVLRCGRGPRATLLGRRLADQPVAMTRVIATLMVGLFVVMMARAVLSAFMGSSQYEATFDHVNRDQTAEITVPAADVASTRARAEGLPTVDRVTRFPVLLATWGDYEKDGAGASILVARCADLRDAGHPLAHCTDERANAVGEDVWWGRPPAPTTADLQAVRQGQPVGPQRPLVVDFRAAPIDPGAFRRAVGALDSTPAMVVSPDLPGVAELTRHSEVLLVVHGGPGVDLYDQLEAAGLRSESYVDLENYQFVQGMQRLVWTLAVVVLSLGLLSFTVAAIDRSLARRRELTALRLLGTPASMLRWTQWLEAVLPTAIGSVLALACGAYAGASYLQLDEGITFPIGPAVLLCGAAVIVSAALATVTVFGTSAQLDAEHIRTE